jgi:hypothetical protein
MVHSNRQLAIESLDLNEENLRHVLVSVATVNRIYGVPVRASGTFSSISRNSPGTAVSASFNNDVTN